MEDLEEDVTGIVQINDFIDFQEKYFDVEVLEAQDEEDEEDVEIQSEQNEEETTEEEE